MGRFEDMTIERPVYLTNKQGRSQRSGVGQANYEWILGLFDEFPDANIERIIYRALDNLPALPEDPSLYPASGGLFKNGDATGYTLTRLYGDKSTTGNRIVDQMVKMFDAADPYPADPLAMQGLPRGYYRDGDEIGYRIIRKT
jgi:hypothetical protein